MKNAIPFTIMILIVGACLGGAETVSLKGFVKKTGGATGIAGVKVSLVKLSGLSASTGADGAFTLSGTTAIKKPYNWSLEPIQFMIKGNTIVFAPNSKGTFGNITIFSSDGKIKSSIKLNEQTFHNQSITLPRLTPGINFIQVTIGAESFMRALLCVGSGLIMKNEISFAETRGKFILAKQSTSSVADTLKAEKDGYLVKKTAIEKYVKDSIAITLDTNNGNPGACTRDALKAIADGYIAAQKDGDPSKMPLASTVTYLQNNKTVTADKCIWKTAMPIDNSISFFDVDSCRVFVEIISSTGKTPWVLMTWLKVDNGKISGIDATVGTTGASNFDVKAYLTYTKAEDWSILPDNQQSSRQTIINGVNAYLDMFKGTGTGVDTVPWGHPCERVEGGGMHVTPDCISGMPGHGGLSNINVTNRRYAVDVAMGTVDVFCLFMNMNDSHMFRLIDGKIKLIHTVTTSK
jgi:hypothetical protein